MLEHVNIYGGEADARFFCTMKEGVLGVDAQGSSSACTAQEILDRAHLGA
jgi:hypothetical protein